MLDHAQKSMTGKEIDKTLKKKIIISVKKNLQCQQSFKYITKHAGKGIKSSLKRFHKVDNSNTIIQTFTEKEQIEDTIFEHNTHHYRAACNTQMYKDKIYPKLQHNDVRNAILDGTLSPSQCNNENVYKFLVLLK